MSRSSNTEAYGDIGSVCRNHATPFKFGLPERPRSDAHRPVGSKVLPGGPGELLDETGAADLNAATRDFMLRTASRAGLKLNDYQMAILLKTAPYALAMAARVRKPRDRMEEPALVFRFPN